MTPLLSWEALSPRPQHSTLCKGAKELSGTCRVMGSGETLMESVIRKALISEHMSRSPGQVVGIQSLVVFC